MEKLDLKKEWKHLYQPSATVISTADVPPLTYLMIDGEGDPNTGPAFAHAIEALYSLSYTLKFSMKKSQNPIDYGVMPLEGLWWADNLRVFDSKDKSTWKWTAMILQPDFIDSRQVESALEEVRKKKRNLVAIERVRLETLAEGKVAQILYVGPFEDEGPTIQRIHDFIHAADKELCGKHHEIYLSDPRRTVPEKLKTIIRQPMK